MKKSMKNKDDGEKDEKSDEDNEKTGFLERVNKSLRPRKKKKKYKDMEENSDEEEMQPSTSKERFKRAGSKRKSMKKNEPRQYVSPSNELIKRSLSEESTGEPIKKKTGIIKEVFNRIGSIRKSKKKTKSDPSLKKPTSPGPTNRRDVIPSVQLLESLHESSDRGSSDDSDSIGRLRKWETRAHLDVEEKQLYQEKTRKIIASRSRELHDSDRDYEPKKIGNAEKQRRHTKKVKNVIHQSSDTDENDSENPPKVSESVYLGPRNNECPYCGALHLPGKHWCCCNGRIFIPPFPRLPHPLNSLYFDVHDRRGRQFKEKILSYNTAFSFASLQYRKVKSAAFGPKVVKSQGPVRHFPSALFPKTKESSSFGNYYVHDHDEAVEMRMNNPYLGELNQEIVSDLTTCMTKHNPFSTMYKSMAQCIEEAKKEGHNPDHVRLKIIDAHGVNRKLLKEMHSGIYKSDSHNKQFVSVFYDSSVEQEVNYPGLTIYPKRSHQPSRPIYPWMKQVTPLCYPLLFPRGEAGYKTNMYPVANDPKLPYRERLEAYARFHPEEAELWDAKPEEYINTTSQLEGDPNLEESRDEYDGNLAEHYYDKHMQHHITNQTENGTDIGIHFVERNGDIYPSRSADVENIANSDEREIDDDLNSNSSADELETEDNNVDNAQIDITIQSSTHENTETMTGEEERLRGGKGAEEPIDPSTETKHRNFASFREYGMYIHQKRLLARNRIGASRKLGQLFTIDMGTRLHQFRSQAIREHHTEYLTSTTSKFLAAYQRSAEKHGVTIGCVTNIPSTVPGSPRYLNQHFENGVTLVNEKGKPDIFATFTCDVHWREIQENLEPGTSWEDNPFLVNEVFKKKFEIFLEDLIGKPERPGSKKRKPGLFGQVAWYTYSIEFQQRGPPHAHVIISLVKHIRTASEIDRVSQAELPVVPDPSHPDYEKQLRLRKLVERFMLHRPCENDCNAYCRQNKKAHWKLCCKRYPKEFNKFTKFDDRQYPELRRRDTGEQCPVKSGSTTVMADNRHVIPHNLEILSRYECHCNIEVVSNLRVLKYLFKYLFKGFDRVLVEAITSPKSDLYPNQMTLDGNIFYPSSLNIPKGALAERKREADARLRENNIDRLDKSGNPVVVYDETYMMEDMRATTAPEAAWDLMGLPRNGCSHTVVTVFVHEPHDEPVATDFGEEAQEKTFKKITEEGIPSRLKSWFDLNKSNHPSDRAAKSLTYDKLPTKYIYENSKWRKRKIDCEHVVGRVKHVSPRHLEQFAIRLLARSTKGPTSFEDLRTVDGELCDTFADACRKRGLMNDEAEWDHALTEAAQDQMPVNLRRMFITILLFCAPKDPRQLWESHKEDLFERKYWSEEQKEAHALYHIESGLKAHGLTMSALGLPEVNRNHLPQKHDLTDDLNAPVMNTEESAKLGKDMEKDLNDEQRIVFDTIVETIQNGSAQPFFIEGSGGCGKTYVYKALYHALSGKGYKVLSVAHTGIASILLPYGATAHRTFSLPLVTEDNMHSKIELESSMATDLQDVDVVLWDEATMTDRRILQAVHELFSNLHPEKSDILFGGVSFIFGGDFRQTLPIVTGVRDASILNYTILRSDLWQHIKVLHLYKNMRAIGHEDFISWLKSVGDGTSNVDQSIRESDQEIDLPQNCLVKSEHELIESIFGGGKVNNSIVESSTILTVDNKTALDINDKVLKLLPGEEVLFKSIDTYDDTRGFAELDPECYNMITPTGLPPHKLFIKVGSIVILLRNLNVSQGLCNGTRMKVLKVQPHVITCQPIGAQSRTPEIVYIHRILLSTTTSSTRELAFVRQQFPLRLAYSMTINKSQGQTFEKVGLLLRTPPFTHGQLFVAVSRVHSFENLIIYNSNKQNRQRTSNIVFRDALI